MLLGRCGRRAILCSVGAILNQVLLEPNTQVFPKGPLVPGQQEAELGEAGAVAAAGAPREGGQGRGDAGHDAGLRRHVELLAAGLGLQQMVLRQPVSGH